jgi:hypothetical protein
VNAMQFQLTIMIESFVVGGFVIIRCPLIIG